MFLLWFSDGVPRNGWCPRTGGRAAKVSQNPAGGSKNSENQINDYTTFLAQNGPHNYCMFIICPIVPNLGPIRPFLG